MEDVRSLWIFQMRRQMTSF